MGLLEETLRGKSLADYTNTQLRLALGAVLHTNTADMWKRYLNQIGYTGDVSQMLQKYYVDYSVPSNFRNYINAGASIFNPQHLFLSGQQGYVYDLNDQFAEKTAYRRNLLTYTDEWTQFAATNSTKSVTSGVLFFTETAVNNIHELSNVFGIVSGTTYTYQVKAKADLRGCINLGNSGYMLGKFNLRTGAVNFTSGGNPWFSGITASISNAGDGYYQCTVTATCLSTQPAANWRIGLSNNDNDSISGQPSYLGVVGYGVYLKDIQVELGSTATEYQRVTDWNTELLAAFPQTTVYLDSAGTTAASVNGLVGLVLDKSKAAPVARRNLAAYTEDYANAYWNKVSVTLGLTTAPDGSSTASTMTATAGAGDRVERNGIIAGATGTHTYSIYLKRGNTDLVHVSLRNSTTATNIATSIFNVNNGTVSTVIDGTSAIESVGSGWYRCSVTSSGGVTAGNSLRLYAYCGTSSPTIGHTASIWGAQLEAGATAGIYQKVVADEGGWLLGNHAYQSTTGNKPVLRGTPVGGNLVTNGDFASDTGWTVGAGWAITGGQLVATAATGIVSRTVTLTGGNVYRLTVGSNTAALQIRFVNGTGQSITFASGTPTVKYFTYTAGAGARFEIVANGTTTGVVDNVEIVDVSAGSVQAPYALQFDGVDDFLRTASVDFATVTSDGLAQRNLLTFPTAFDNAAGWPVLTNVVLTGNQIASPDGTLTADLIVDNATSGSHRLYRSVTVGATQHTLSVYAKAGTASWIQLNCYDGVNAFSANFNVTTGVVGWSFAGSGTISTSITSVGSGWYRCSITPSTTFSGSGNVQIALTNNADIAAVNTSYVGTGTGVYIWGAQIEVGSTASAFQDIGTDKMTVCHGVRKLSDSGGTGTLVEFGTNIASVNGSFSVWMPHSGVGAADGSFNVRGTTTFYNVYTNAGFAAPITAVVSGVADISAPINSISTNGVVRVSSSSSLGTGNFGNYAFYFGRRGGSNLPYNGLFFSAICVGKAVSASELANIERWTNQRTGAY